MRQILHAHQDGRFTALDHPDAVVVDYAAEMIRVGERYWPIPRFQHFRFLAFMLRSANLLQHRSAIAAALGTPGMADSTISALARRSAPILAELGMVLETVYGTGGYQLHTDPRESLPCCRNLAPGQPLPSRLRNTLAAPGQPLTTCARSLARSTIFSGR